MNSNKLRVSWRLFLLNILGCLLVGLGTLINSGASKQLLPVLASDIPAWPFFLLGLGLMGWFLIDLIKRIRTQEMHNRSHNTNGNKNGGI